MVSQYNSSMPIGVDAWDWLYLKESSSIQDVNLFAVDLTIFALRLWEHSYVASVLRLLDLTKNPR